MRPLSSFSFSPGTPVPAGPRGAGVFVRAVSIQVELRLDMSYNPALSAAVRGRSDSHVRPTSRSTVLVVDGCL
jgi:hypothetical protein